MGHHLKYIYIPFGKQPHNELERSTIFSLGKSTISMAMVRSGGARQRQGLHHPILPELRWGGGVHAVKNVSWGHQGNQENMAKYLLYIYIYGQT